MTPRDLIAAFETLADAPDGVKRLRELALQLAVRGKLVPQDPADEPASVLLARIAAEKARLVQSGKARATEPLQTVGSQEVAFPVPRGWQATRFGGVFSEVLTGPFGTALKKSDYVVDGTPVVNPQNLQHGYIVPTPATAVGSATLRRLSSFAICEHDIVVARRGEMGRCAVVGTRESGWLCGTGSLVLRPTSALYPPFVALFLRCPDTVARLGGESVGATMMNLNQRIMTGLAFVLPPLAEQHRIVARVDELMGLLDRLEAARNTRDATRAAARDAALAALRDADDAEAVQVAWARIAQHIDDLFTHPDDVAPLRQTILQLAVRGRLVPQDPTDEPARVLLQRIAAEKAQLVKAGKIRKAEPLPPIREDEVPFAVPEGWEWARLGSLLVGIQAGKSPQAEARPKERNEWGVLKVSACSWGVFQADENKALLPGTPVHPELEVRAGDFILCRANTLELVARGALVESTPERLLLSDKTLRLLPAPEVNMRFVRLANESDIARAHYATNATGTSASMRNVGQQAIRELPLAFPPLAEQHRIVARVDALMALCDALESKLIAATEIRGQFAAAAVHQLEV